jgi:hypothetical protein
VYSDSVTQDRQLTALPAGDYRPEMPVGSERTGAYEFTLKVV